MEQLVRDGLVREIGVCNFGTSLLRDLMSQAEIQPAMLQVEMHPYLTQEKLTRFCHESGHRCHRVFTAWSAVLLSAEHGGSK